MPREYRTRGQVVHAILATVQREGPIGVTRLTTAVNLTHSRIQDHLASFDASGLISNEGDGWRITPRGAQALEELRRVDRAMRDFGIGL